MTQVGEQVRTGGVSPKDITAAVVGQLLLMIDMMSELMKAAEQDRRGQGSTKGEIAA